MMQFTSNECELSHLLDINRNSIKSPPIMRISIMDIHELLIDQQKILILLTYNLNISGK